MAVTHDPHLHMNVISHILDKGNKSDISHRSGSLASL